MVFPIQSSFKNHGYFSRNIVINFFYHLKAKKVIKFTCVFVILYFNGKIANAATIILFKGRTLMR